MLYAITSYFNPFGFKRRKDNYQIFRQNLEAPLITIELGFNGQFDLVEDDADVLVQIDDGNVMFQKERLLNCLIYNYLPDDCDFVAWFDCDVVLDHRAWAHDATKLLSRCSIVQLFSHAFRLENAVGDPTNLNNNCYSEQYSFAARFNQPGFDVDRFVDSAGGSYCRSGLAWAARRELLILTGLYDCMILGSGDRILPSVLCGSNEELSQILNLTTEQQVHLDSWACRFNKAYSGGCVTLFGTIVQLWHGNYVDRKYKERHLLCRRYGFDPATDLVSGSQGAWRWSNENSQFAKDVYRYFENRKEDG